MSMETVFKTQVAAVGFLKDRGFQVEKSKFNVDFKAKLITKGEGGFSETALLAYAVVNLKPKEQPGSAKAAGVVLGEKESRAALNQVQADRMKLKFDQERGELVPRSELVLQLSLRAQQFKNDLENFPYMEAANLVALCGGDEGKIELVREYLTDKLAAFLDAYSIDREFVLPGEEEPLTRGELQ